MNQMESAPGPITTIDGKEYVYFCGTSYLCLQGDQRLIQAACQAVKKYGTGTATSRSGYGTAPPLARLETRAAEFYGSEKAFCFSSGYSGPAVLLTALADQFHVLLIDEASHYSGLDAARLFETPKRTFRHRDPTHLKVMLEKHCGAGKRPLVITDGVFPISGALAPLNQYLPLVQESGGAMLVDDAHALGVLGKRGRGTAEHFGIENANVYITATLSKAIGGHGGVIPCSTDLFDRISRKCGLFDGASPPDHAASAASEKGLEIVMQEPQRRRHLFKNSKQLKAGLQGFGIETDDSPTPIVCIDTIGNEGHLRAIQKQLCDSGILIAFIDQYTGVRNSGALRIAVFSEHTQEMIDELISELGRIL